MSRVHLAGEGFPIPISALPDPNLDTNFPPQAFLYTASGTFDKTDFANLGYTHFEVICIGAAAGRGADGVSYITWANTEVSQTVPQAKWDLVREHTILSDYMIQASMYNGPAQVIPGDASGVNPDGPWRKYLAPPVMNKVYRAAIRPLTPADPTDPWTDNWNGYAVDPSLRRYLDIMGEFGHNYSSPPWDMWEGTYMDLWDPAHSSHKLKFATWNPPVVTSYTEAIGGAGGGGGLHKAAGLLADLPTLTPIVVGTVGPDSPRGQTVHNGIWTPVLADAPAAYPFAFPGAAGDLPYTFSSAYNDEKARLLEIEVELNAYLTSYPLPHPSYPNPQKGVGGGGSSFGGSICQASGGEGGDPSTSWPSGVKTVLGFGGDGGSGDRIDPGGGAAGSTASGVPGADGTWDGVIGKGGGGGVSGASAPVRTASHGGRGSYSFADPSVYGPRQQREGTIPGGGGGALLTPGQYYGSKAPGSNPNGAVYLRLTKIG